MKCIYLVFAVMHCYAVGTYSTNETVFANVIGTLELISRRTLNIEEKVNGYGNFNHELDGANEHTNCCEELRHELDYTNEKLDRLVESVGRLESVYDCGWPELPHGHFEGKSTFYRDVLHAVCDEGYSRSGYQEVTCNIDRKWSSLPTCKPDCQAPPVPNSLEYDTNKTYSHGANIRITCKQDYRLQGLQRTRYLRCDGENGWVGGNVQCHLVDCGQPPVEECGTYGENYNTTINSTLSLTCNEGFLRFGPDFIHCEANGRWKGRQMCIERTCVNYTMQNGTNSTECMLKTSDAVYIADTQLLGTFPYANKSVCLQYCLENHNAFTVINLSWGRCSCLKVVATYYSYVHTEKNNDFYFREVDKSTYLTNLL